MDASVDGGLLLELYSREGAHNASMISSDFYQVDEGLCGRHRANDLTLSVWPLSAKARSQRQT